MAMNNTSGNGFRLADKPALPTTWHGRAVLKTADAAGSVAVQDVNPKKSVQAFMVQ